MCARIIDINENNIDDYGLFCKKSQKKEVGYQNKVKWIKERFKEGLKYKLLLVKEGEKETSRGFIEYIPAESCWRGIQADGWMIIHCLWVVGKHKKKGYGSRLLNLCLQDAQEQGMNGVVGMSVEKGGWLPSSKIYIKNGFKKVDELDPYLGLYAKPFLDTVPKPQFYPLSDEKLKDYGDGLIVLHTHQCPYLQLLVEDLEKLAKSKKTKFQAILLKDSLKARENGIHPYGTCCMIYDGKVLPYKAGIKKEITELLNKT
ncbi:MAG: GNAT family N-acetyltransferase [Promethearchaeota archaeon]